MIIQAIEISIMLTAIHILFWDGMLLGWLRIMAANLLDWMVGIKASKYIQKPMWDCLPCMSLLGTVIITWGFNIKLILLVCGLNVLIEKFIDHE